MTNQNAAIEAKGTAAGKGGEPDRRHARRRPEWVHRNYDEPNSTERMVLSLQLLGLGHRQIAERLGKHKKHIAKICRYRRYREAFNKKLAEIDEAAFHQLKPQVYQAVLDGLNSEDEGIQLRAAELWLKTMGPEAFRRGAVQPPPSAEDVATAILARRETVQPPPLPGAELRY
jgi:hypothetical protein